MPAKLTDEDIDAVAGDIGATSRTSGRTFNEAGLSGVRKRPPAPQGGSASDVLLSQLLRERLGYTEDKPSIDMMPLVGAMREGLAEVARQMAINLARIQRPQTIAAPTITVPPAQVTFPPPASWSFKLTRNDKGELVSFTATPI